MKKHIMLMGIQGSGKGTQAEYICRDFGYIPLEIGAIFRSILEHAEHRHYKVVSETVPQGIMVPDEIVFDLIREFIEAHPNDKILIDGAVRNIAQRKFFDAITTDYCVINITLTEEEALRRLQGRKIDPITKEIFGVDFVGDKNPKTGNALVARIDDQDIEKIHKRFAWYHTDIVPLLENWQADGVEFHTVNGEQSREEVWEDIQRILTNEEGK